MSDILIIQNARYEGPAVLGELLRADGFDTTTVLAKKEKIPAIEPRAIVILGAPESANDDFPYLREELNLIRESVRKNIPVLGICLGSQLIAKSLGARVYQGNRKEIGFYQDIEFDNTVDSKLFYGFSSRLKNSRMRPCCNSFAFSSKDLHRFHRVSWSEQGQRSHLGTHLPDS